MLVHQVSKCDGMGGRERGRVKKGGRMEKDGGGELDIWHVFSLLLIKIILL